MKSLQADFFKVMKEGAIQYAAPLPFLDLVCVGTATQTEVKEQIDLMYSLIHQQVDAIVLVSALCRCTSITSVVRSSPTPPSPSTSKMSGAKAIFSARKGRRKPEMVLLS